MNTNTTGQNLRLNPKGFYIVITIVITMYLLASCSSTTDGEIPAESGNKPDPIQATSQAESLFVERENIEKLREAVRILSTARNPAERNFDVEWKFAKFSYFLGKQSSDEAEADSSFESGRDAGRIASRMEPNRPDGHFWFAANLGELSRRSPITVGLKSVDDIREAMNKVIEIQPDYQGASAFDALGQLELKTRLTGGKTEKAIELLEKGLSVEPDNANIRLHLAEAYFAVKKTAEAKKHLETLIKKEPHPDYVVEHTQAVREAKELLAKKF